MLQRFGPGARQSKGTGDGQSDGLRAKEGGREEEAGVGGWGASVEKGWPAGLGWAGGSGLKKGASDASVLRWGRRGLGEVEVRVDSGQA